MDSIKKSVDNLFLNAENMDPEELDTNFSGIMKEGEKAIEQSGNFFFFCLLFLIIHIWHLLILEDKVQLAGDMHELMTKYMRRLDHELNKFKMELEADNSGITGLIEKSKNWYIIIFIF